MTTENEKKGMTWQELKDFCNALDDDQLSHKIVLWREDSAVRNIVAEALPEDHYIDPEDTEAGCFPLSDTFDGVSEDDLKKVYDKGHPILFEEF